VRREASVSADGVAIAGGIGPGPTPDYAGYVGYDVEVLDVEAALSARPSTTPPDNRRRARRRGARHPRGHPLRHPIDALQLPAQLAGAAKQSSGAATEIAQRLPAPIAQRLPGQHPRRFTSGTTMATVNGASSS
jgi:hypothetical protein